MRRDVQQRAECSLAGAAACKYGRPSAVSRSALAVLFRRDRPLLSRGAGTWGGMR